VQLEHDPAVDGHDPDAIAAAIEAAQKSDKPTLIACKTVIGFGAPNKQARTRCTAARSAPTKSQRHRKSLNWESEAFAVPDDVLDAWRLAGLRSTKVRKEWDERLEAAPPPKERAEFVRRFAGDLPGSFDSRSTASRRSLPRTNPTATRKASEDALEVINGVLPEMIGGSADLTPSNNTKTSQMKAITPTDFSGRYIHYGIREHGMAAAMNGIALHGGLIPYGPAAS
jgi:transketolase